MADEQVKNPWDKKISKAEKFQQKWHEHARKVYDRYEDERKDVAAFLKQANIFYSNVNTLKESLFNSLPKPDVRKIHRSAYSDDLSRVCCTIVSRALAYEVECAPNFEEAVSMAVLDRLVPGMGQVWVTFDVEEDTSGKPIPGTEHVKIENVSWDDFIYEPCKRWSKCNWVGRRVHMSVEDFKKRWGDKKYEELGQLRENKTGGSEAENLILKDKVCVYEIWDKPSKKIVYVVPGLAGSLEEIDDPYKLKDFFPCPRPLIANVTTRKFLPVTDYHIAQDQYIELDALYGRISLIVKAIKVAGVYDSSTPSLARMLTEGENRLIPVDSWAMFAEKGGLKGAIDFYPVEQVATVLQYLQAQFEAVKAVLYEITGMSDIVRGASNQYETAAAQQIKAQFASVRMNGYQRDVAIFVRGILRIISDLVFGGLYGPEKLQQIIGELEQPDMQFYQPALEVLSNDLLAKYRVDIQANSLTQADWALEKQERMEVTQTLGGMLSQILGIQDAGPELKMLSIQMIKFAISGFRGATEFESWVDQTMDQMARQIQQEQQNPTPPEPTPEEKQMQMEMQMKQQEQQAKMDLEQAKMQMDQQKQQQQLEFERQKNEMELAHRQQMYQLELQMKQMEMGMKERESVMNMQNKAQEANLNAAVAEQNAAMKLEQGQQSFEQSQQQSQQSHEQSMKQAKDVEKNKPKDKTKGKE